MPSLTFADQGQGSDYKGASILQRLLPDNSIFLADGGYDDVWLRESLKTKGMAVCIPPKKPEIQHFLLIRRCISVKPPQLVQS